MKRIMKYMKQHIGYYILGTSTLISAIVLDMYNPYLIKRIIDDVIIGKNTEYFKIALICLGFITFGRAVLGYIKEYTFDFTGSKIVADLRQELFDHIQTLSFSYFDENNTGELMSRIKEDAENIHFVLAFGGMILLEQIIYFVIATVILININWKLTLISLVTMPIIAYLAVRLEKKIADTFEKLSDQRVVLNTTAQENLSGVRLVKAFAREKYEINKFLEQNKANYDLCMEQTNVWSLYYPKIEFLSNIVIVLVTSIGGYMVVGETMSIGTLVAFSNYIYMLIWPMRMIGWLTNLIAQCAASLKKIEKIFEEVPEIKNVENPIVPEKIRGGVIFDNVSFNYNGEPVLKNININVRPGSTTAIMGITGSGKSSIINLIGRFYDCESGRVLIDGVNIKDIDLKTLRNNISAVLQDTFLFSDTIEENIKFGNPNASRQEVINAAKDAMADEFIIQLTDEYATVIGERGIGLSGGQKQRISIARALARNSKILILDDATSALDMKTEYKIQKALERRKDITKFIIAHRISAAMYADEIIILEDGEIVERGNHNQLLSLRGRYYETYLEQFQGMIKLCEEEVV